MDIIQKDNLTAFKTPDGVVGFHAHNLQVADLDSDAWDVLSGSKISPEISTELASWNRETDPVATDADLESSVRSYSVNVTQVCNLKCTYCAAGGDGSYGNQQKHIDAEMIRTQLRTYLNATHDGEIFVVTFFGGEPLLALDTIQSLARYAKLLIAGRAIDLRFRVITNGTLVTDEAVRALTSLRCHVTVSLDGPPEINDRQRRTKAGKPTTAKTLAGLEKLATVRAQLGSLSIGSVFGKHNTDAAATYAFLSNLPVDEYKFDFASDIGDENASRDFANALSRIADDVYRSGGEQELRKIAFFDHAFRTLDQQKRIRNHCGAGKSHVFADARGKLSACQWFMGRPDEVFNTDDYRERLQDMNDCGRCWARNLCGGGCLHSNQLKHARKNRKDSAFCERTRTLLAKAITLYADARRTPTRLEHAS